MGRRSEEELLAEFHRLSEFLEAMVFARCEVQPYFKEAISQIGDIDRQSTLDLIEEGKATLGELVSGVRESLNDMSECLVHDLEDRPKEAEAVLRAYQTFTGREFWDDVGHPQKILKYLLKSGHLKNETEARLAMAYAGAQDSGVVSDADRARLDQLFEEYEARLRDAQA